MYTALRKVTLFFVGASSDCQSVTSVLGRIMMALQEQSGGTLMNSTLHAATWSTRDC